MNTTASHSSFQPDSSRIGESSSTTSTRRWSRGGLPLLHEISSQDRMHDRFERAAVLPGDLVVAEDQLGQLAADDFSCSVEDSVSERSSEGLLDPALPQSVMPCFVGIQDRRLHAPSQFAGHCTFSPSRCHPPVPPVGS